MNSETQPRSGMIEDLLCAVILIVVQAVLIMGPSPTSRHMTHPKVPTERNASAERQVYR